MKATRVLLALAISFLATNAASADDELSHEATSNRSFAKVEHWVTVFDDPERDAWQKPGALVEKLGVQAGHRVADLGAGTGYLLPYLSQAVGKEGAVFAIDTEPTLVEHMRARAETESLENVTPVLASADNPRIPANSTDLVLILDTYHHLNDRLSYVRALKRVLRDQGRIAIVDWRKRDLPVGPPPDHKLARSHVISEMTEAGFELREELDLLPHQYVLVFRPDLEKGKR